MFAIYHVVDESRRVVPRVAQTQSDRAIHEGDRAADMRIPSGFVPVFYAENPSADVELLAGEAWIKHDIFNQSTDGIRAIKCALRSAQNFYAPEHRKVAGLARSRRAR